MKTIALLLVTSLPISYTSKDSETVYYCDSPTAKRYHKSMNCKGLENCSHEIREATVSEAEQLKLTKCKLEK